MVQARPQAERSWTIPDFKDTRKEVWWTLELTDPRRHGHDEYKFMHFPRKRYNQVFELWLARLRQDFGLAEGQRFRQEHFYAIPIPADQLPVPRKGPKFDSHGPADQLTGQLIRAEIWQLHYMCSVEFRDFRRVVDAYRDFKREAEEYKSRTNEELSDDEWWVPFTPYEQYAVYEEIKSRLMKGVPYDKGHAGVSDRVKGLVPEWDRVSPIPDIRNRVADVGPFNPLETETRVRMYEYALDVIRWVEDVVYHSAKFIGFDDDNNPVWALYPDWDKTKVWVVTDYELQHIRKFISHYKLRQTEMQRAYDMLVLREGQAKSIADDYFWTHLGEMPVKHLLVPLMPDRYLPVGWTQATWRGWWLGRLAELPGDFRIHMGNWTGLEHGKRKVEYVDSFRKLFEVFRAIKEGTVTYKLVQEKFWPELKQEEDLIFWDRGVVRNIRATFIEGAHGDGALTRVAIARWNDFATWLDLPEVIENDQFFSASILRFFYEAARFVGGLAADYALTPQTFLRHRDIAEDFFLFIQDYHAIINSEDFRALEHDIRNRIKSWKDIADLRSEYVIRRADAERIATRHGGVFNNTQILPTSDLDTESILVPVGRYIAGRPAEARQFIRRDLNDWFNELFTLSDKRWEASWQREHEAKRGDKGTVNKAFSEGYFSAQNYFPRWPNAERQARMVELGLTLQPSRDAERLERRYRLFDEVDKVTEEDMWEASKHGLFGRKTALGAFEHGYKYHRSVDERLDDLIFWLQQADLGDLTNVQAMLQTLALDGTLKGMISSGYAFEDPERNKKLVTVRRLLGSLKQRAAELSAIDIYSVYPEDLQQSSKGDRAEIKHWQKPILKLIEELDIYTEDYMSVLERVKSEGEKKRRAIQLHDPVTEEWMGIPELEFADTSVEYLKDQLEILESRIRRSQGPAKAKFAAELERVKGLYDYNKTITQEIPQEVGISQEEFLDQWEAQGLFASAFFKLSEERRRDIYKRFHELRR